MKVDEIRKNNSSELNVMLLELRKEAFNLRFQRASGGLAKTDRTKEVRKLIAKVMTIQNERKLNLEVGNA